jgi:hypothetical protein
VDDPVTRHARVVALEHHVADGARGARTARDDGHETVARDASARDGADDLVHAARPRIHERIVAPCAARNAIAPRTVSTITVRRLRGMSRFTPERLRALADAEEVTIEATSAGGKRHRVPIWVVVDDATVFARSYNGPTARWYRELLARPGTLVVGTDALPVRAVRATDADSVRRTSEGYQRKYPRSPSLRAMQRPEILDTTIRLEPVV